MLGLYDRFTPSYDRGMRSRATRKCISARQHGPHGAGAGYARACGDIRLSTTRGWNAARKAFPGSAPGFGRRVFHFLAPPDTNPPTDPTN